MSKIRRTKLLIIGSGPAGYTAAIYAARAALDPILVQGMQPGGQLTITTDVENYPGFAESIQGPFLMEQMSKQAANVGAELVLDMVETIDLSRRPFIAETSMGEKFAADSVIISTGAEAKWLGIPSELEFQGFGVSGCATCDGFFFKGKQVAVIGGGNTAVEEALFLTNHAAKVYLIHRRDELRADKLLQKRLFDNKKISVIWNHVLDEVLGTQDPKSVTGMRLSSSIDGKAQNLDVDGIFIAIGHKPNTGIFKNQILLDEDGYIITAPDSTKTNIDGVFAAGDVQDKIYRQAVTAAATGCMAALEAEKYIRSQE